MLNVQGECNKPNRSIQVKTYKRTYERIIDFAWVLENKTFTKFNEQSIKFNHSSTSFDFNVLEQIKHYEKVKKVEYQTSLIKSLSVRWREEAYEKFFVVFYKTLTKLHNSTSDRLVKVFGS